MSQCHFLRLVLVPGALLLWFIFGVAFQSDVRSEDRTDSASPSATTVPRIVNVDHRMPSTGNTSVVLSELLGSKATVLVFLSTECPISNGYVPTLNQLNKDYADRGVKVIGIHSNDGTSLREVAAFQKDFAITFPMLKDAGAKLAEEVQATHCPETVVLDDQCKVRYRGRIDDRFAKRGGGANDVRRFDLTVALNEVLAKSPVSIAQTTVVGCPIIRRSAAKAKTTGAITYSEHIASILRERCETCHRSGGIGPFALQTFDQAVQWSEDIREFTTSRQMPPWLPKDGAGDFHNRRVMTTEEIAMIANWIDSGCASGDLGKLPPAREFSNDWKYGVPDLIVQSKEPFDVPADGKDVYRCFVIPTDFDTDQFVQAVEVRPGNSRVVHHVIVFLDTSNRSPQLDAKDPGPGYSTSAGFPGFLPAGGLGGWAPGNLPRKLPDGVAKVMPAKAKLVVQVHYHPSGKIERDQTEVGIYFSRQPVKRVVRVIPVMPFGGRWSGMRIPAGDDNVEVRCSMTIPRDVLALTVTPHMHLLGKDMSVTATLPDGEDLPLLNLQRWDFNWQESYQYREPVKLPKGTQLELVAHFDNSTGNPANPNRTPRDVYWGENTVDEMCIAFLEFVPAEEALSPADLKAPTPGELLRESIKARLNDDPKAKQNR